MRLAYRLNSPGIGVFFLALTLSSTMAAHSAEAAGQRGHRVPFRTVGESMIVVPVEINGAGPFNFLLDTGTTRTMVDEKLAEQLALHAVAQTTLKLTGISGTSAVTLVGVESVGVAGETVRDLHLNVRKSFPAGVRGILGEDFLARFDVLIDYRQHALELSADRSLLAASLEGEHLPFSMHGAFGGAPTGNRIVIQGHAREFDDKQLSFLLDSGTDSFVLFPSAANGLNAISLKSDPVAPAQHTSDGLSIRRRQVRYLFLEGATVPNVSAVVVDGRDAIDADGVIPTAWFKSLFICHSGGYVIFNPSPRSLPATDSGPQVTMAKAVAPEAR